jgi:hypothetical protein
MNLNVLLVTGANGAEECAAELGRQLRLTVELVATRRAAVAALRKREYSVVVVDELVVQADPAGADVLWLQAGTAIPVQVNLGISGCERVLREVRAAMQRREREMALSMKAAAQAMEGEMKTTLAGLLLQAELALAEPGLPTKAAENLRHVVESARALRDQLRLTSEAAS